MAGEVVRVVSHVPDSRRKKLVVVNYCFFIRQRPEYSDKDCGGDTSGAWNFICREIWKILGAKMAGTCKQI